jgi:hypothetical protein
MRRTDIINSLIAKNNYKSYLEIGINVSTQPEWNWAGVNIPLKHGVDPNVPTTYSVTSDEFFEKHIPHNYDIIFVDGLHIFEQVYKDIINSLDHLNEGGIIIVHDCNPMQEIFQRRTRESDAWNGDVWKSIVKLRMERDDICIRTVDTDEGCGIISRGSQELIKPTCDPYDYSSLDANRKEFLNLISVSEFKMIYLT